MRSNVKLTICSVNDSSIAEVQVYTNYNGLTTGTISLMVGKDKELAPEIGNFPHMSGHNLPVRILEVVATLDEDNAGMDISNVLDTYKEKYLS